MQVHGAFCFLALFCLGSLHRALCVVSSVLSSQAITDLDQPGLQRRAHHPCLAVPLHQVEPLSSPRPASQFPTIVTRSPVCSARARGACCPLALLLLPLRLLLPALHCTARALRPQAWCVAAFSSPANHPARQPTCRSISTTSAASLRSSEPCISHLSCRRCRASLTSLSSPLVLFSLFSQPPTRHTSPDHLRASFARRLCTTLPSHRPLSNLDAPPTQACMSGASLCPPAVSHRSVRRPSRQHRP